ncbi:hypothetical protein [Pseudobacteriovorax antillogorgiicola]|nr:hypothetical protein [Pseudobacteriovorax antillogorgiicola]
MKFLTMSLPIAFSITMADLTLALESRIESTANFSIEKSQVDLVQVAVEVLEQSDSLDRFAVLGFYDLFQYSGKYQIMKTSVTFSDVRFHSSDFDSVSDLSFYKSVLPDTEINQVVDDRNFNVTSYFKVGPFNLGSSSADVAISNSEDSDNRELMLESFATIEAQSQMGNPDLVVHSHYTNVSSLAKESLQLDAYYLNEDETITVVQYFVSALSIPDFLANLVEGALIDSAQKDRVAYAERWRAYLSESF